MKDECPSKTHSFSTTCTLLFDKLAGYIYLYCNFCSLAYSLVTSGYQRYT